MVEFMRTYFFCLLLLLGCTKQESPKLPEPVEGDLLAHGALPGVVKVLNQLSQIACTGTFVSPRAVLTAAHCLEGGGPYDVRSPKAQVSSSRGFSMANKGQYGRDDLGIIVFDSAVVDSDLVIGIGKSPSVGETVTLIGYGCTNTNTRQGGGVKRMGTNVLSGISDYLEVSTPVSRSIIGPKNRAGSCFGDSGSPLLVQSGNTYQVVGVDHGARIDDREQVSVFVNLSRSATRRFLEGVNASEELSIPGL